MSWDLNFRHTGLELTHLPSASALTRSAFRTERS